MKEHSLLLPKKPAKGRNKVYVKYTSPVCAAPFETIEADIKYVYIHGARRNAYLITLLDVFTRMTLVWTFQWDMKTQRIIELIEELFDKWLIPCGIDPLKIQVKIRYRQKEIMKKLIFNLVLSLFILVLSSCRQDNAPAPLKFKGYEGNPDSDSRRTRFMG